MQSSSGTESKLFWSRHYFFLELKPSFSGTDGRAVGQANIPVVKWTGAQSVEQKVRRAVGWAVVWRTGGRAVKRTVGWTGDRTSGLSGSGAAGEWSDGRPVGRSCRGCSYGS